MLGRCAKRIDAAGRVVHLDDGASLGFERLLIATGGKARMLPISGGEHVVTLRTLDDAAALRQSLRAARRVVCIGAGVIGLEVAASARKLGAQVTVLEAGARAMERCVPAEISAAVEHLHRSQGVELRFGEALAEVSRTATGYEAVTVAGTSVLADLIIAGVGIVRDLELAENAGIEVDGGIKVDGFGETSVPGIFAAGDVASVFHASYGRHVRLENWRHAQNHAIAVGRAMAGDAAAYDDQPYFWTDQFGMHLQVCGFADEAVRTVMRDGDGDFLAWHLDADGRLIGASAANRPRDFRMASKLVHARARIDVEAAADPATPVQRLVKA
jgi:3-phenylpropionate/trans-cinnamate dioxygenase ferredoxin reductase subunit